MQLNLGPKGKRGQSELSIVCSTELQRAAVTGGSSMFLNMSQGAQQKINTEQRYAI